MDGFTTARLIRELPNPNRAIPIVALTAAATQEDRQHCFDSGMNAFLTKPISRNALLDSLRAHVVRPAGVRPS